MKGTEFLKKYGAAVLIAACENQFATPEGMAENEHLMVELTDDQDAVISSVVDGNGNHVAYVDEYLALDNFDLDEPDISKMSQQELIDLAIQIEGSDHPGRSFEESAKYWRDQDDQEKADLFTAMAARWWELGEKGHEEKPEDQLS